MQDELVRIKAKDYSYLDERLYNNIGVNSDLEGTINHLYELQCYLKSQIESLPEVEQKEAALRASKVMLSSIVSERKLACNCGYVLKEVEVKIEKIKRCCKNLKESMSREIKCCILDVKEILSENCQYLINVSNRKMSENSKLKIQIYSLQEQLLEMKEANAELTAKLEECKTTKRKDKMNEVDKQDIMSLYVQTEHQLSSRDPLISYSETNLETERYSIKEDRKGQSREKKNFSLKNFESISRKSDEETPKIPMPLRRESCGQISRESLHKVTNYKSTKNINEEVFSNYTNEKQAHGGRVSWKQSTMPTNILDKENEMLKRKGADMRDRKSTKKLKLFSMV